MASIPLMVNPAPAPQGPMQQAQSAMSLQGLLNQAKLQQQQEQQNQQTIAQQQIKTQEAQQQQQDIQRFNKVFQDSGGDWNQAVQNASGAGVSPLFLQQAQLNRTNLLKQMQGYSEGQSSLLNDRADAMGKAAMVIKDTAPDQRGAVAAQQLNVLKMSGIFQPGELPDTVPTDDASLDNFIVHSKATQDLVQEAQANKIAKMKQPGEQAEQTVQQTQNVAQLLANAPGAASWQSILSNAKMQGIPDSVLAQFPQSYSPDAARQAAQMSLSPESRAKLPVENMEMASYMQQNPGKTPADFAAWKAQQTATAQIGAMRSLGIGGTPQPGTPGGPGGPPLTAAQNLGQKVGLTPDALDQAANSYLQTGQIQSSGSRGIAGMAQSTAIRNRAAELDPSASLMQNKGVYQANAQSLKNLQKNYDMVTSFENTALKNLDQVAQAGAQVPDLGTRYANVPVRMINSQMLGTPEMARFKTALLTAQTEAAKVLSSANANGVLSDQARKEAEDVLDGNLPYPAMIASINQLKTDFGNREQSYQSQISDIQGRMRQGGPTSQQQSPGGGGTAIPAAAKTATGPGGHKIFVRGNQWIDSVTGKPLG
ncbi:MAG: hypothetical protein ACRD2O_00110 [Terriglobia bacterium]